MVWVVGDEDWTKDHQGYEEKKVELIASPSPSDHVD
jgi:hypothetical protein